MKSQLFLSAASILVGSVSASFDGNLNYDSPSTRHDILGIDVELVERRSLKRGNVAYQPSQLNFTHGIASGDPWPESVILWTRVAPTSDSDSSEVTVDGTAGLYSHETEQYVKADSHPICVEWKVFQGKSADSPLQWVVAKGKAYTTSDIDYTVKVRNFSRNRRIDMLSIRC
jgi:alkaline phosphatase D